MLDIDAEKAVNDLDLPALTYMVLTNDYKGNNGPNILNHITIRLEMASANNFIKIIQLTLIWN